MKKTLILVVLITVLTSCSSARIINNPIYYYLDNIVKERESLIIVIDKKISNRKTLAIFKGDFMYNSKTNTYEREGKPSSIYNKKDWDDISKKYSFDSIAEYWKKSDFELDKITIVKNELFVNGKLYKEYKNKEFPVYAFSNPIYYHNRKFMIFTVINSNTSFGAELNEFVIVMKKENNKWVIFDKVYKN